MRGFSPKTNQFRLATGIKGAETVVTVELAPQGEGTHLRLTHEGLFDAA